jgi:hypothetical protein
MYHRRISTAIVFIVIFTLIEVVCAVGAWRAFGKNLWDKLHEAFSTDEIAVVAEEVTVEPVYNTEDEENEDGYVTED